MQSRRSAGADSTAVLLSRDRPRGLPRRGRGDAHGSSAGPLLFVAVLAAGATILAVATVVLDVETGHSPLRRSDHGVPAPARRRATVEMPPPERPPRSRAALSATTTTLSATTTAPPTGSPTDSPTESPTDTTTTALPTESSTDAPTESPVNAPTETTTTAKATEAPTKETRTDTQTETTKRSTPADTPTTATSTDKPTDTPRTMADTDTPRTMADAAAMAKMAGDDAKKTPSAAAPGPRAYPLRRPRTVQITTTPLDHRGDATTWIVLR